MFIQEDSYRIIEDEGPLEVCLELNYATDADFAVTVDVAENSPPEAMGIAAVTRLVEAVTLL